MWSRMKAPSGAISRKAPSRSGAGVWALRCNWAINVCSLSDLTSWEKTRGISQVRSAVQIRLRSLWGNYHCGHVESTDIPLPVHV
jgi:hypothetical protein